MSDVRDRLQVSLGSAYQLDRELGGGGMSRTYLATERALSRRVVVKVLAPELLANISVERFKREVLLAAQLQHPHVVPVLASGDADGLPWFTMPYVEGESLRMRLARGPLRIGEAVGILRDVARALEFAHGHNVVHRDIKPDNVLLAGSSATVTDFGIAKAISASRTDGAGRAGLTMTGQSIGTPAYMAPEQAAGEPHADPRSDIYSYGVMAYEMLTGRQPFAGTSAARVITAHFTETPRPVSELRSDIPDGLADLVMRCLEKDVSRRPQTAADIVRVVDAVVSSGAAEAAPAVFLGGHIRLGRALAMWGTATLLVGITAWAATAVIGLPDWVFPGSLGVMLAGLPVIGLTWYVQHAARRTFTSTPALTPGGSPSGHSTLASLAVRASPHVSWRRAWLGGVFALGAFVVLVVGFMVLRALGIGPVGSLMAAGKLDEGTTLVVADFQGPPEDSALGTTVAEALRTDLSQSRQIAVMSRGAVREVLRLMQRPVDDAVYYDLAREIATREGAKGVLDGRVVKLGNSYIVSARVVSALDGMELASFRRTADNENELIAALGLLSRDIRARIGESLKNIREATPLTRVSTPSLAALRKYVEGIHYTDDVGDVQRGLGLLEEAVAIDSSFAMAWRKIGTVVANNGLDRQRALDAVQRAFRHRERLSETERLITEATYYFSGPEPNLDRALVAYEALLQRDPGNYNALNNAGVIFYMKRDYARAEERYRAASLAKRPFAYSFLNLVQAQLRLGNIAAAESTRANFRLAFPQHESQWEGDWFLHWGRRELEQADSLSQRVFVGSRRLRARQRSAQYTAEVSLVRGRVREFMRWRGEQYGAVYRATGSAAASLRAAMDSARAMAFYLGDAPRGRALIRAALAATPVRDMPVAMRPWSELGELGASLHDPSLAREALTGLQQDLPQLGLSFPDAEVARLRAWHALASGRHDLALTELRLAESRGPLDDFDRRVWVALAESFDAVGQLDSARVYYDRYVTTPDVTAHQDAWFLAPSHARLGELHQANGNVEQAETNYARFLKLWDRADPELQPKVREIRDRLTRLRRQRG